MNLNTTKASRTVARPLALSIASAILLLAQGCGSWFLQGAEMADGAPSQRVAAYSISSCTASAGETIAGPDAVYYLAQERGADVLYEIEGNGNGARIINGWNDERGRNFFVWVSGGAGWHYIIPNDTSLPATRIVYAAGTYTGDRSTGVVRPVGTPVATCPLTPMRR